MDVLFLRMRNVRWHEDSETEKKPEEKQCSICGEDVGQNKKNHKLARSRRKSALFSHPKQKQNPTAKDTTHFRYQIQRSQAETELEMSNLLSIIHSAERCLLRKLQGEKHRQWSCTAVLLHAIISTMCVS